MEKTMLRTSTNIEGPYLVVTTCAPGTTSEQLDRAFEAAQRVFDAAGVDPVEAGYRETDDPQRKKFLDDLWAKAEQAATVACWEPRNGPLQPTQIEIYIE